MKTRITALALSLAAAPFAHADKLNVPADFATIQAAVDAANPGDKIIVQAGKYDDVDVIGVDDLEIRGKGKVIIDAAGFGNALNVTNCTEIRLKNLKMMNGVNGVLVSLSSDVVIDKCVVKDSSSVGVLFNNSSAAKLVDSKVRSAPFGVQTTDSIGCLIDSCSIEDTSTAITLKGSLHTAKGNQIDGVAEHGIRVGTDMDPATGCLVLDNVIENAGNDGIFVNGGSNDISILDNVVKNSSDDGIYTAHNSTGHLIDGNAVRQVNSTGIMVGSDQTVASRNVVKKSASYGLLVQGTADDGMFQDNRVKKSGLDGIRVSSGGHAFIDNVSAQNVEFDLQDSVFVANTYVGNEFGTMDI